MISVLPTSQCNMEFSCKLAVFRAHVHLPADQDVLDTQLYVHAVSNDQFPAGLYGDRVQRRRGGIQKEGVAILYDKTVPLLWKLREHNDVVS